MRTARLIFLLLGSTLLAGAAACAESNTDGAVAPAGTAPPASSQGDTGASAPAPRTDASTATLKDGPSAHLLRNAKLTWKQGPDRLERNCKNACADASMTCQDETKAFHHDLSGEAVGVQVMEAFSGDDTVAFALSCDKDTSDSYNKDGKGYMPLRTDCTCHVATKLVESKVVARCKDICKGVGLTCDDAIYWGKEALYEDYQDDPEEEPSATGGGRAKYGNNGELAATTLACDELAKDMPIGLDGELSIPPTEIDCACR